MQLNVVTCRTVQRTVDERIRAADPLMDASREEAKIGVCVLTFNSAAVIERCLDNLRAAVQDCPHELIVVDNHSSDSTAAIVRKQFPEVELIPNSQNLGYARGNNIGARLLLERGCTFLAFLNPDVCVQPDTLQRMQSVLMNDPRAGCAGAVAIVSGGVSAYSFRNRPGIMQRAFLSGTLQFLPLLGRLIRPLVRRAGERYFIPAARMSDGAPVYAVSGACIMFPAWAFLRTGGFDPSTFLFQEELIVSERLRRIDSYVVGVPGARYHHIVGHSMKQRPARVQWHFIRSEQYFLRAYERRTTLVRYSLLAFRLMEWALYMGWLCVRFAWHRFRRG